MINKNTVYRDMLNCIILPLFFICSSCETEKNSKHKRAFTLTKTDDDNWSTSARIQCDSVDMISNTHAIYWIDGHKFNLHAKSSIKIFSNSEY